MRQPWSSCKQHQLELRREAFRRKRLAQIRADTEAAIRAKVCEQALDGLSDEEVAELACVPDRLARLKAMIDSQ